MDIIVEDGGHCVKKEDEKKVGNKTKDDTNN